MKEHYSTDKYTQVCVAGVATRAELLARIDSLEADKQGLLEYCDALRAAGLAAMKESGRLEKENSKVLDALAGRFYPDGVTITDEMRETVRAFVLDERYQTIANIQGGDEDA